MKADHFILCILQIFPKPPVFFLCLFRISVIKLKYVIILYVVLSLEKRFRPITVSLGKWDVIVGLRVELFERLIFVI